jgi:hypothetical protein
MSNSPAENPLALYVNHAQSILHDLQVFDETMATINANPKGLHIAFLPKDVWPNGRRIRDKIIAGKLPIDATALPLFEIEQFQSEQKNVMDGVLQMDADMRKAGLPGWTVRCVAAMHKLYLHVFFICATKDDGAKVRMLISHAHNPPGLAKFAADLERLEVFWLELHTVIHGTLPPTTIHKTVTAAAEYIRANPGKIGAVIAEDIGLKSAEYFRRAIVPQLKAMGFWNDSKNKGYFPPTQPM